MLKASSLTCAHDGDLLFANLNLVLGDGDRIGVVGPNGAGKTTLLRTLAGFAAPAGGTVTPGPGVRVGYMPQQMPDPDGTVGAFLTVGEVAALTARLRELEIRLAAGDDVLDEYGAVQDRWTAMEGWQAETRVAEVRQRLDLAAVPDELPLSQVSGGEQARLLLARALLVEPDVLLLDEPTNHLDADGAAWLQEWLRAFPGGVLVVSHDRAFLDATVSRIVELDGIHDEPLDYPGGGYTAYRAEKQRRWERLLLDFEAQEKDRRRWEADIERLKQQSLGVELTTTPGQPHVRRVARLVARKAKVRERRLRRQMESTRWLARPRTRPPLTLAFPADAEEPGEVVVKLRGLTIAYGGRTLLDDVDVDVRRGDRILVTGRNGVGKTTLVRALAAAGSDVAVLPQTSDGLRSDATVMEFFRERVPVYVDDAERLLAGHQFGPDQWSARTRTLSAGELRRLVLAVLVNGPARVLVLDEPTNFLDFEALDVVEEALRRFRGTLVTVTHDRYFAAAVGYSRRWHVEAGAVLES